MLTQLMLTNQDKSEKAKEKNPVFVAPSDPTRLP